MFKKLTEEKDPAVFEAGYKALIDHLKWSVIMFIFLTIMGIFMPGVLAGAFMAFASALDTWFKLAMRKDRINK